MQTSVHGGLGALQVPGVWAQLNQALKFGNRYNRHIEHEPLSVDDLRVP